MMEKFRIVSESGDKDTFYAELGGGRLAPVDKDEWFEDYERELDENENYGEDWA